MGVASRQSRQREPLLRGCSILALVFGAMAYGHAQAAAPVAAGPFVASPSEAAKPSLADPAGAMSDKPAERKATGNPVSAVLPEALHVTRERPLFSPSRHPPAPPAVAAPAAPPPPPPPPEQPLLTLVGTVIGDGGNIGVFVDEKTNGVVRLRTGESHDGWTLRVVRGRQTVLEKDRRDATLTLSSDRPSASPQSITAPQPTSALQAPPTPQAEGKPRPIPPGMWRDGDGQIIAPPNAASNHAEAKPANGPRSVWRDGDGRAIAPPPDAGSQAPGKRVTLASPAWTDGDGRSIRPPVNQTGQAARP